MSVYKEGWYGIQRIAQAARQVYSDAMDFGVPVHKGDCFWVLAKQLSEMYGIEDSLQVYDYYTGKHAQIDIELMEESDNPSTSKFRLGYVTMGKSQNPEKFDGYLTLEELDK